MVPMSRVLKPFPLDRPGWIPSGIARGWDTNPYAYQTEEELMPGGGLHGQLLAYLMELLRAALKARGLMLLMDTFLLYRDNQDIKQRIAPDLLLMPLRFPLPSAYDLDVEPPPPGVLEVTSPKSHFRHLQQKVPFYLGLGIPSYLVIDAITARSQLRKQIELHGWQLVDDQPCKMETASDGSLALPAMGLRIRAQGQRIIFVDEVTGEMLCDSEQLNTALQAERQAHLKTLEAYHTAEAEIARLKALLEKK
jgi:Uma2 family endonuclease